MRQHEALVAWRRSTGLSQAEAAKQLRVSQAAWAAWETGAKAPDLRNAIGIEKLTAGKVSVAGWAKPRRRPSKAKAAA